MDMNKTFHNVIINHGDNMIAILNMNAFIWNVEIIEFNEHYNYFKF